MANLRSMAVVLVLPMTVAACGNGSAADTGMNSDGGRYDDIGAGADAVDADAAVPPTDSGEAGSDAGPCGPMVLSPTVAPSLNGLPDIPSEFDPMTTLVASAVPGTDVPDLGAFRFQCTGGQLLRDDPIVSPGQPGIAHLHQFFGNMDANACSTYETLRAHGRSTCQDPNANPANRSGYWIPALLDGIGNVIQTDAITIYYKRWPATDPHCGAMGGFPTTFNVEGSSCAPIPNGLRVIFGFNLASPGMAPTGAVQFICGEDPANFETMTQALDRCRARAAMTGGNTHLITRIEAPNCWNGRDLDSPDHRSHTAYASYGDWGYLRCPVDHPIVIPTYTMTINYTILPGDDTTRWRYSSDESVPGVAPGETFHGDVYQAWDPGVRRIWTDHCIDMDLNCESGQVGNGFAIRGADAAHYWIDGNVVTPPTGSPNPRRLVPLSSLP